MKGHGQKLTRKQEAAISNLLAQPTIRAAANATGVGEVTLHRWLADPGFKTSYLEARREGVSHTIALLQRTSGAAVAALHAVMSDPEQPASARVSAARAVLELAIKGVELEDLAARLEALEAKANGGAKRAT